MEWSDLSHEGFNLYEEAFDGGEGLVYLKLNGCPFTASSSGEGALPNIEVEIPPQQLAAAMGPIPAKE